jgi:hypothetical protein
MYAQLFSKSYLQQGVNFILKDNKLSLTPSKWLIPIERDYPSQEKAYLGVRTDKKSDCERGSSRIRSDF